MSACGNACEKAEQNQNWFEMHNPGQTIHWRFIFVCRKQIEMPGTKTRRPKFHWPLLSGRPVHTFLQFKVQGLYVLDQVMLTSAKGLPSPFEARAWHYVQMKIRRRKPYDLFAERRFG